jgi:hypothetical protein
MKFLYVLGALSICLMSCRLSPENQGRETPPALLTDAYTEEQLQVMDAIMRLDAMRRSLSASVPDGGVDTETFASICRPVGIRAREIGEETGWTVRQISHKYRNPDHRLDAQADSLVHLFLEQPDVDSVWVRSSSSGFWGIRYLRRISVEASCLNCHGAKASRPEFVVEQYPEDRAFDFEEGDLRGLYSVFVPVRD